MSQLNTILGCVKQTNLLCVVMFADKTGGSDVPNTDADWAFFWLRFLTEEEKYCII